MGAHRVLVTDIDGTLIGDDAALDRFADWMADHRDGYRLAYATGRLRESLVQLIANTALPEPDAVISGVGTEIHGPDGQPWPGWRERLDGWDASRVRAALRPFRWLEPQSDTAQTALKASYDVPGLRATDLSSIRRALTAARLVATLVYSANRHLDVLPAAAGKGIAARFLADAWAAPPTDVLVFGDSGNDLQLFRQGFRGTLVANALPELSLAVGKGTYRSHLPYAAGVLDGIRYWSGTDRPAPAKGLNRSG